MKRQHSTVAIAVVLFLAVRMIGAALTRFVPSFLLLPYDALVLILSAALPACLFLGKSARLSPAPLKPPRARHFRYLLLLPFFVVSVSLLASVLTHLAELAGIDASLKLPSDLTSLFLTAAILPAVVEEILCRYLCFLPFSDRRKVAAIWISSVIFALLHVNLVQIPYALFAGLMLGALFALTDSILIPILFHLTNNLVSILFVILGENSFGANLLEGSLLALAAISIPFLLRPGKNEKSILGEIWEMIRPRAEDGRSIAECLISPLLIPILLCLWLALLV